MKATFETTTSVLYIEKDISALIQYWETQHKNLNWESSLRSLRQAL